MASNRDRTDGDSPYTIYYYNGKIIGYVGLIGAQLLDDTMSLEDLLEGSHTDEENPTVGRSDS
jgi:hypothetical protein